VTRTTVIRVSIAERRTLLRRLIYWKNSRVRRNASVAVWIALIAFLGLILLGNIALVVTIWRGFKDLKAKGV
jgi:hypothetical protein